MDTQALKAFVTVAKLESFSLAAEQLHLTQPAISKRINTLEAQLDTLLFERHNRTVSLTHNGQKLLPKAREILNLMEDTEQSILNNSNDISGPLALGTSHHIGLHKLPPILSQFVADHPAVNLQLEFMDSEFAFKSIRERKLDLALSTLSTTPEKDIEQIPLWQDKMVFVCGHQHPLSRTDKISLEQLTQHHAILPDSNTITFNLLADLFTEQNLSLESEISTNYLETNKMLASVGLGWTMLPSSMIDNNLHIMRVECKKIYRALGIIFLKNRTLPNTANALLNLACSFK